MKDSPGFIPAHGNYRELLSYRKAEVVYDVTYRFCRRFLATLDRTNDQMIQAARSGETEHPGRQQSVWNLQGDGN
jgi:hypothetical protein